MNAKAEQYRGRILRTIVSERPIVLARLNDPTGLDDICVLLADCADAKELLRRKGYGQAGMSVLEIIQTLPTITGFNISHERQETRQDPQACGAG